MPTDADQIRLRQLLSSLTEELAAWKAIAEGAGGGPGQGAGADEARRFAPHQSQLLHLVRFFDGVCRALAADIDAGPAASGRTAERILQTHAIWDWFRAKLLLRYGPTLAPWLSAADELAWACLHPLAEARAAAPGVPPVPDPALLRVPPLIYLGPQVSPFVYPRDWRLTSQIPGISDGVYLAVLQRAPFALIGMPYYETSRLAETLVLAHEIGHVVDLDLGLREVLDGALAVAAQDRLADGHLEDWRRWRLEAFADCFGAAAGGLAYCRVLADFLQRGGADLAAEPVNTDPRYPYPTRYLRLLLVLEVLRGPDDSLPKGAADLLAQWHTRHGTAHAGAAYERHLPLVVGAFLDTPLAELGGRAIRDLLQAGTRDDPAAREARDLLLGLAPTAADPRTLFAAATLAFAADPVRYQERGLDRRVLARVRAVADDRPRARVADTDAGLAAAGAAGAALANLLDDGGTV